MKGALRKDLGEASQILWLYVKPRSSISDSPWCESLGDIILTAYGYWTKREKFKHEKKKKWCNGGREKASYISRCIKKTMCRHTYLKTHFKNISRLN